MAETLEIVPIEGTVDVGVTVPGSKSLTNRAIVISALADGQSRIQNALDSEDTRMMMAAVRALGFQVDQQDSDTLLVTGAGGCLPRSAVDLNIGNSGTSARFLTALVGLGNGTYRIDGVQRMRERPIQDLIDGLAPLGVAVFSDKGNGCPPLTIQASGIRGGHTRMKGSWSSQYFSAILLVASYAAADVTLDVVGELTSQPYVAMTVGQMARAGVTVETDGCRSFAVAAGQRYRPGTITIEPDASNASYFFAAAALTGGRVRVAGLGQRSVQGDAGFVDVLDEMGCGVSRGDDWTEVSGTGHLLGVDVDLNGMPDMVQTLCALAPFADGPVNVRNVANLRIKETDRLAALVRELSKLGVRTDVREDGLTVYPSARMVGAVVDTYQDHRMAMALALIGLRVPGVVIRDPGCVAKTFPGYFDTLDSLRA